MDDAYTEEDERLIRVVQGSWLAWSACDHPMPDFVARKIALAVKDAVG